MTKQKVWFRIRVKLQYLKLENTARRDILPKGFALYVEISIDLLGGEGAVLGNVDRILATVAIDVIL